MTPRALAEAYGLTTADTLARPGPKKPAALPDLRARWPEHRRFAFAALEPAALSLVATDGPVSVTLYDGRGVVQRLGHNRGIWPARILKTQAWRDTASTTWDRNPFFYLGTQFRVWCTSEDERDRLAASVVDLIARRAEEDGGDADLMHGFQDLGPDLDLELFELEVHDAAKALGIASFDDAGLVAWLDGIHKRAVEMAAAQGRRVSERTVASVAKQALGNRQPATGSRK